MPKITIGTLGFSLQFTAKLPPKAQAALEKQSESSTASFGLTPSWGNVPTLLVGDLRKAGVKLPDHWVNGNAVAPMVHGTAFYIEPVFTTGMAVSFAMKGVNLRTGLPEKYGELTDEPCQSFWSEYAPRWIDGYVPSDGQAVSQFAPLRGEKEMAFDVASHVGVAADDPFRDGIAMTGFLPKDIRKLQHYSGHRMYGGDPYAKSVAMGGDEELFIEESVLESVVEEVGMGAGARMRQRHEDNPSVSSDDFFSPLPTLVMRLVWSDHWNQWAIQSGEKPLPGRLLSDLEARQKQYEARIWKQVGGVKKSSNVDGFPSMGA